jgi:hypothetical protein
MSLRSHSAVWFITTAMLTLSACSQVKIKDFQVCGDIGTQGATCDNFLTEHPVDIRQPEWDDYRFGMLCISSDSFGELKREIEQLCSAHANQCDYETQKQMKSFFKRMEKLK